MIKLIPREELFRQSVLADNDFAYAQNQYAADFEPLTTAGRKTLKKFYDHRRPFNPQPNTLKDFTVLAYPAQTRPDYETEFPGKLGAFLQDCGVTELFLATLFNHQWQHFPFVTKRNFNQLKRLAGMAPANGAIAMDLAGFQKVFPLFLLSYHYNGPGLHLIPKTYEIPFVMFYCKDGNWHLSFPDNVRARLTAAAEKAGFVLGDTNICSSYSMHYLT